MFYVKHVGLRICAPQIIHNPRCSTRQQEKRMNKATEVMMQYVENLKRTYEKDHAELMEFKKLANQNSIRCYGGSVDAGGEASSAKNPREIVIFESFLCTAMHKKTC